MQQKLQFSNGYTFNRVINGCWQLSAEHCLQGKLDYDDAIRAFHMLVERGFTTFDCADLHRCGRSPGSVRQGAEIHGRLSGGQDSDSHQVRPG